jgi:hypothetical protein
MEEITILVKNKKKLPFLKELLSQMDFVKIADTDKKTAKKKQILSDIDEAIDFVNSHKKNKTKAKSLKQLLNEL